MKIKNKKIVIFILAIAFMGIIGTTYAYYQSNVVLPNRFQTMTYNVTVEENFNNTWGTKEVTFKNNEETNIPVVLRINYNEQWSKDFDGAVSLLSNKISGTDVVTKNWTTDFTDNFVLKNDGWYYYKKVLGPQESVKVLNSIALNSSLISSSPNYSDYQTYDYRLDFNFEAIQVDSSAIYNIWNRSANIFSGGINRFIWNSMYTYDIWL